MKRAEKLSRQYASGTVSMMKGVPAWSDVAAAYEAGLRKGLELAAERADDQHLTFQDDRELIVEAIRAIADEEVE